MLDPVFVVAQVEHGGHVGIFNHLTGAVPQAPCRTVLHYVLNVIEGIIDQPNIEIPFAHTEKGALMTPTDFERLLHARGKSALGLALLEGLNRLCDIEEVFAFHSYSDGAPVPIAQQAITTRLTSAFKFIPARFIA